MIAEFLAGFPPRMSNVYRATLTVIWRYACAEGLVDKTAPGPGDTIPRAATVQRKPLTMEGFEAIRGQAPEWLRRAMDLALESLQGRTELSKAKREHLDGDIWYIVRQKTESWGVSARMRVHVWPELRKCLLACQNLPGKKGVPIASPFIVHKEPQRLKAKKDQSKRREHHTQVLPEDLTRAFAAARDACEMFQAMPPEERPTFHEIRALGADRKRKAGWSTEAIQLLMTHTDEEMTEPPWTDVAAPK